MASLVPCLRNLTRLRAPIPLVWTSVRHTDTLPSGLVEKHRESRISHDRLKHEDKPATSAPRDYKYVFPDFLPDPNISYRDKIAERLYRQDMLKRRSVIDLPEFYVGSIVAVTVADPYATGKTSRFVGLCISRDGYNLRSFFTLRNHVDGEGIEIEYDLYNPTLHKIEVLKLEKRLDDSLFYLRDCPQEFSTIPQDFEAVMHPPGAPVPINDIKVKLGPRPWHERWERQELKGVQDLGLPDKFYTRAKALAKPWEKRDIMLEYRSKVNDDESDSIMAEVHDGMKKAKKIRMENTRKERYSS